jgi:dolichol-phosphate mannosyltransferase
VNDGCPCGSWDRILELAGSDQRVKGINLSRNFGQHHAITAGLDNASGEWTVVMDCDLQDRPEEIGALYQKALAGYDIVLGRRVQRHDGACKKYGSKLFYALLGYLTDTKIDSTLCNFGIYHRRVVDSLKTMREELRFFPLMVRWTGFRTAAISIEHAGRPNGKSGYSFRKLFQLAFNTILGFSDKPLWITVRLGALMSAVAFLFAVFVFVKATIGHIPVTGWASLMVSLWFCAGLVISILGIIGIYLGKTFDQTKGRPLYIIKETVNAD